MFKSLGYKRQSLGAYANAICSDNEVRRRRLAILELDATGFRVQRHGLVIYFQHALGTVSRLVEGGAEQLLVDVNAVEVVVLLMGSMSVALGLCGGECPTDRAKLGLVVPQTVFFLHFSGRPVVHDEFLEDHLCLAMSTGADARAGGLTGFAALTSTPHCSRKRDPLEAALSEAPTSPAKSYRSYTVTWCP